MAWVRYDDQFHTNAKVTAVIAENPAALALHVLANTWTNGQKRVGFIPKHQPGVLVCDRSQGAEWAEILTRYGLWHDVSDVPNCPSCAQAYEDLDLRMPGFVIHDSHVYRAPARERQTPGTPTDLSEKRRLAGSKGGKQSAARREQSKQNARANEANDASKASNGSSNSVSPVVNASNEALTPEPGPEEPLSSDADASDADQDTTIREDVERVCVHLADRIEQNGSKRPTITQGWRDSARRLMDLDGRTERQVHNMIDWCQRDEWWRSRVMSMPKLREKYDALRLQALPKSSNGSSGRDSPKPSTTDQRVAEAQALKARFRTNPPPTIAGEIA